MTQVKGILWEKNKLGQKNFKIKPQRFKLVGEPQAYFH